MGKTRTLVAGAVMMMLVGLIYAWSIFRAPLAGAYPAWSTAQMSLAFTISMCCWCVGGLTSGKLLSRLANGHVCLIAAALLFAGFLLLSFLPPGDPGGSLVRLYVFYGVFCGLGVGLVYNSTMAAVLSWFPGKTGTMSGILLMCYGFGGLVFGSVVSALVASGGLARTFFVLAIGVGAIVAVGALVIRRAPTAAPSGSPADGVEARRQMQPSGILRTATFWLFFGNVVALASAGLLVINSAAVVASDFGAPAILGLLTTVAGGAGRVAAGLLFDIIGRKATMTVIGAVMVGGGGVLLLGASAASSPLIIAGLILVGISFGGSSPLTSSCVNHFFGAKHYAANYSTMTLSIIPASVLGPAASSALYESGGEAWGGVFALIAILGAVDLALVLAINRSARREALEA
ncbi:MAG: MFS transporter [Clostridiales Family XIII bacterium]|jgi:OFA family oxalate/formate antiporter-like MFS transporter|nr:MFS transporter [Clostridiales Family XIII bacterium]